MSVLTGLLLLWQLTLYASGTKHEVVNSWFNAGYASVFVASALLGFIAHKRRYISGAQGKALWLFSLGSLSFAIALYIWAYSGIVKGISTPFPSSADVFFTLYTISVGVACVAILELLGPTLTRRIVFQSVGVATLGFILVFVFFIIPSLRFTSDPIVRFFTIVYPVIACALMSLVMIASRSSGGTSAKSLKLYFLSLGFLAVALVLFLYRHNIGSYWNGDITDFFCLISGYTSSLAAIELGWGEA